jgi:hypothetical protein
MFVEASLVVRGWDDQTPLRYKEADKTLIHQVLEDFRAERPDRQEVATPSRVHRLIRT